MFEMLGFCVFLAALLALNTITSSLAAILWQRLAAKAANWSAALQARWLFTLRVAPVVISLAISFTLVLPAYLLYEPRHKVEPISYKIGILAALSALGISLAIWRGVQAWIVTHRLRRNWLQSATPVAAASGECPLFLLPHPLPVVAIIGFWRPRLFIADHLYATLTSAELAATLAHEYGHVVAKDNLKRAILRICCDVFSILPSGRSLDRAWAKAAEAAADERAARGGRNLAVELAGALVKIARLIPPGERIALPIGAVLLGQEAAGIALRVQSLLRFAETDSSSGARPPTIAIFLTWLPILLLGFFILFLISFPDALQRIHEITELVVSTLK